MENLKQYFDPEVLTPLLLPWGMKLLGALAIFLVGKWVARALSNALRKLMGKGGVDSALAGFLGNIAYAVLLALVIIAALDTLGVETTSIIAIFGAAGLAVGLALQGSLSNFAAGVMLMIFRPFKSGDFVEAGGVNGVVEQVRVFNTIIRTGDNREITVPNKRILDDNITNFTTRDTRRIDMVMGIGYDDDIRKAKQIIERVLGEEQRVLKDPAPVIMVLELADSSVNLAVRPWVKTEDYWATRGDLLHKMKIELEGAGLSIPYPQRDVHIFQETANG